MTSLLLAAAPETSAQKPSGHGSKHVAMKTYTAGNLEFQGPAEAVSVDKIGYGIYKVTLADKGGPGAWIKLVFKDSDQLSHIPGDKKQFFKGTYLGVELPAEKKVTRQFAGKKIEGELHRDNLPKPTTMEIYLLDQPDGSCVAVNLARFDDFSASAAEGLFSAVASSLHITKNE
jgi:hypothetical protein